MRFASLAALAAIAVAGPALAAQTPPAANLYTQQDTRSIAVQNWSAHQVARAQIRTTDGRVWTVGKGSIPVDQAAEVLVPGGDCIAGVRVQFQDGRVMQMNNLHACHNTQIVVRNGGLSIPQLAVPGAKQHATPG